MHISVSHINHWELAIGGTETEDEDIPVVLFRTKERKRVMVNGRETVLRPENWTDPVGKPVIECLSNTYLITPLIAFVEPQWVCLNHFHFFNTFNAIYYQDQLLLLFRYSCSSSWRVSYILSLHYR